MRAAGLKRSASVEEMPLRRAAAHDYGDEEEFAGRSGRGLKLRFSDRIVPRTLWGKIAAGCALVLAAGAAVAAAAEMRSFLLHDARFVVPDEAAIEISGVNHLTRAQLLSIFGEDVDRNIFRVPLEERRAELERVPWVEHATVMRLLPDHLRVAIVERTPVAFVRQGTQIGLVDASGALFDLPGPEMVAAGGGNAPRYSFPVITGISAADPASTRAARMKIYMAFMAALDATGEKISSKLSEVNVSDPDDVRAVVPDAGGDMLVHFGGDRFLERYHAFQQHLAEWRAQYPNLASADMRYERQVVLGMKPGASTAPAPVAAATATSATASAPAASPVTNAPSPAPLSTSAAPKPATAKPAPHPVAAKTAPHRAKHTRPQPKKKPAPHTAAPAAARSVLHTSPAGVAQ